MNFQVIRSMRQARGDRYKSLRGLISGSSYIKAIAARFASSCDRAGQRVFRSDGPRPNGGAVSFRRSGRGRLRLRNELRNVGVERQHLGPKLSYQPLERGDFRQGPNRPDVQSSLSGPELRRGLIRVRRIA